MRAEAEKTLIWNGGRAYFRHPKGQWFDLGFMVCRRNTELWCRHYGVKFVEVAEIPARPFYLGRGGFEFLDF